LSAEIKGRKAKPSLINKVLALFIIVSTIPMALAGIFSVQFLSRFSVENMQERLRDKLTKAELIFGKRENELEKIARSIAGENLVIVNLQLLLQQSISTYMDKVVIANDLSFAVILKPDGSVLTDAYVDGAAASAVPAVDGETLSRAASDAASTFAANAGYRSPIDFRALGVEIRSDDIYIASIAPIRDFSGDLLGFALAGEALAQTADGSRDALFDEICRSVEAPVLVSNAVRPLIFSESGELDGTTVRFLDAGAAFDRIEDSRYYRISIGSDAYVFLFSRLEGAADEPIGSLALGISEKDFYRVRNQAIAAFVCVAIIALMFSTILAYFSARSITRPVITILEGTRRIIEGDTGNAIVVRSKDEIGALAEGFNTMSAWLKDTLDELKREIAERIGAETEIKRLNEGLEMTIRERTLELEKSNDELGGTIRDLQATRDQLVESEKMAVLGQLVAGIAHELNTPLGAITSSNQNFIEALDRTLRKLPALLAALSERELAFFMTLYGMAADPARSPDAILGDRGANSRLMAKLQALGVEDPFCMADDLLEIGFSGDPAVYSREIVSPRAADLVRVANEISWLIRSSKIIETASEKASKVIQALKTYMRLDIAGETTVVDIRGEIDVILTLYYNKLKQGIEIRKEYEEVPRLRCHRDRLNQVWVNLINNAIQAMNYRGLLGIRVFDRESHIGVSISDSGPGIPEAHRSKLFTPFFTTKQPGQGTGLGLSISKGIIEEHEGTLVLESGPGMTTFTVLLPKTSEERTNDE